MIDFPNHLGLWKCVVDELELVSRGSGNKKEGMGHPMMISGRDLQKHMEEQQKQMEEQ